MTSNDAFQTPETLRNFDDFKNMFKGIDREDRTPDDVALKILEKVKLEYNQSRLDDVVEWFDEGHYYEIRSHVDELAEYLDDDESDVSDIED